MPELTGPVLNHRMGRIMELGFDAERALELAQARNSRGFLVDLHELRRAIARGCDLDTAYAIYA
jgi:hypothetical protein